MSFFVMPNKTRPKLAILVFGQSNELGNVQQSEQAAFPQAFRSLRKDGVFAPFSMVPLVNRGGWWCKVHDDLWDHGYEPIIVNAAIGGMDFFKHACGYVAPRFNSVAFYKQRPSTSFYDPGDYGDIYRIGSRVFLVTNGRSRIALNVGPFANPALGTPVNRDYVSFSSEAGMITAATAPDVSTMAIGDTILDGGITIQRLNESLYTSSSTWVPNGQSVFNDVMGESLLGLGFDPLGFLQRAWTMLSSVNADKKIVYIQNAQANLGAASSTYQAALQIIAGYFLRRNCDVMLGLSCYSPASGASQTGFYNTLRTGYNAAITAVQAAFPGRCYAGADLYTLMGATGAQGGQQCTASISGTTMTVTALQSQAGNGIEVGQRVWNGTTLIGTVTSQTSGTVGGIGVYELSASATVSSTTIVVAGANLSFDGVHLGGQGAIAAGVHVANAFKAVLPKFNI